MTVQAAANRVQYAGNGVSVAFSFPAQFQAATDLIVVLFDAAGVATVQVLNTNYTVSGAGSPSGGTVTMTVAPPTGTTLVIYADPGISQLVDLVDNGPMPAEVFEAALDKLTLIARRTRDLTDRSLRLNDNDPSGNLVLPLVAVRKNKFLAFDTAGVPLAAAGTSANLGPVSAYIDTLLVAVDAAAARTTLGLGDLDLTTVLNSQVFG